MKDKTLLILAAGMGSRFGGLKQIEPMGPNGEFLIDYSIYDAIKAGFTKVVFVIKKENYEVFKSTIGKRVEDKIPVEYAFQELSDIPSHLKFPEDRMKPLGTSHAILAARHIIHEPFVTINADDFYGRDAYLKAASFIDQMEDEHQYAVITYHTANTLTENGSVKRGVCKVENQYLTQIVESSIERKNDEIIASPLDGTHPFSVTEDAPVSMNMFVLTPDVFAYLEKHFDDFVNKNQDNLLTCEYLLPDSIMDMIYEKYVQVKAIPTTARWYGVTYKEDTENVKQSIQKLIDEKIYPCHLWGKEEH